MKYDPKGYYESDAWRRLRLQVLARDRHICQYCGSRGWQADHVIPRSRGGPDTLKNLVCACVDCNRLVCARTFLSFSAKKRWILNERKIVVLPKPTPFVRLKTPDISRKTPQRSMLRQRLATKNSPRHFVDELLLSK
jgi:hypothetical protein